MRTVFRDTSSVFYTRLLLTAIGVVSSVIIARTLGPAGKGQLYFLLSFPVLIMSFINLGIGQANTYFLGKGKYNLNQVISGSIIVSISIGLLGITCGLLIFDLIKITFVDIEHRLYILVLLTIPFLLLEGYSSYIFLGLRNIRPRNQLVLISPIARLVCILILLGVDMVNIKTIVLAFVLTSFLPAVFLFYYFKIFHQFTWSFDRVYLKQAIRFGFIPFVVLSIMGLNYRIDIYIVKYFQPTAQLGLYSVSVAWAERLWWIPQAIGLVLFSMIPGMKDKDATSLTSQLTRISLCLSVLIAACYSIFAIYAIPMLYSKDFTGSVVPFLLLVPGIVSMVVYKLLHPDFTARNKAKYSLIAFAAALILNIVLNMILVPRYGISGAAVSSTISYSVGASILLLIFSRINNIRVWDVLVLKKDDVQVIRNKLGV